MLLLGCAESVPPPALPPAVAPKVLEAAPEPAHPGVPRVVRRLLQEEKELVTRSAEMARALPDPSGRARAEREVDSVAAELAAIEAPLDDADSPALDELVRRLLLVSTRIDVVYDGLRTASARHSAIAVE